MSYVHFLDPIDYISGKISGKFRTIYLRRKQSDRRFTQVRNARTTKVSTHELNIRARFVAVAAMVIDRKEDLSKIAQDQANFIAQKDLAHGKKTMLQYLWYVCGQEYDNQ